MSRAIHYDVRKRRVANWTGEHNALMQLDGDTCYRALTAHDARFDGRFFVGVTSTRIYCRPVCNVRTPRRENCRFFRSAAAAEVAGFRPCLRCRPELAPGNASIDAGARLAQAAVRLIEDGTIDSGGVERLASRVGVTSRHLRRIFADEFGVSPIDYAQTQRLLLAKRLLTDTALPVTDVALTSGFASLRRFNAAFRERYRMAPSRLRREAAPDALTAMLDFLDRRAVSGLESVDGKAYRRTLRIGHANVVHRGHVEVRAQPRRHALALKVSGSLARVVPQILTLARHAFDIACDPVEIAGRLGPLAQRNPGLRLPGTFDGFELAVRAVIGQQVSVRGASTLLARLVERFGEHDAAAPAGLQRYFPDANRIASVQADEVAALGVLPARSRTIVALAQAVAEGRLDLAPGADVERMRAVLAMLPGVGPWTVEYIAMRALGWPDAFPSGDLGILKALGEKSASRALRRSEAWRPWRAYAALHLWSSL